MVVVVEATSVLNLTLGFANTQRFANYPSVCKLTPVCEMRSPTFGFANTQRFANYPLVCKLTLVWYMHSPIFTSVLTDQCECMLQFVERSNFSLN